MKNIIVVGGGAGGLILANSLDTNEYNITVFDKSRVHFYQPWYLYVAFKGSKRKIWRNIEELIKPGIKFVNEAIGEINLNERYVLTKSNKKFSYDYLIVATGITPDPYEIPGLEILTEKYGNYHSNIENARKVFTNLENFKGGTIVLGQAPGMFYKCPPSFLEGIFLIEEYLRKRGLKDKTKLVFISPYERAYPAENMDKILKPLIEERNIEVHTSFNLESVDPENKILKSMEGESLKYDFPIIAPPFRGPKDIKYYPENIVNEEYYIKADKYTLKIKGFDDAFAIGDVNSIPTSKTGVTAHLEAKVVVDIINGRESKYDGRYNCPFDVGYGMGTFVIADYNHPVVPYPPTKFKYFLKMTMADIYWHVLKGYMDFTFHIYFNYTKPERLLSIFGEK